MPEINHPQYTILFEKPDAGQQHLVDVGVGGPTILKWVFKKYYMRMWTRFICFEIGSGAGTL